MPETINADQIEQELQSGHTVSTRHDPDVLGTIFGQILLLAQDVPAITEDQWTHLTTLSNHAAYKLGAVRYHCNAYEQLQDRKRDELLSDAKMMDLLKKGLSDCELEMAFHFEAWCHQVKSSLEMLVQVFFPLLGSNSKDFPKSKYGNKGEKLIKHLEQKKKNKKVMAEFELNEWKIDRLIDLIRSKEEAWIGQIFQWRDDVTHRFPFIRIAFTWDDENTQLKVPMANEAGKERPMLDIMQSVTKYLIDYSCDFIASTISCRKPQEVLRRPLSELEKRYFSILWEAQGNEMNIASVKWRFTDAKPITEEDIEKLQDDIRKWQQSNDESLSTAS